jgi:mRNA interferase MazF
VSAVDRGEIWWLERPDAKRRPCLVLTRSGSIPVLTDVLVVPLTTRVRGLDTEVQLTVADGVPRPSAVNLQHVTTVPKSMLTRRIATLPEGRWPEVCDAVRVAIGC